MITHTLNDLKVASLSPPVDSTPQPDINEAMITTLPFELPAPTSTSDAAVRASYVSPVFDGAESTDSPQKKLVFDILNQKKLRPHERDDQVIAAVIDDLTDRADFYHERVTDPKYQPRLFLRMKDTGKVIDLFEGQHLDDLITEYGLVLGGYLLRILARHVIQRIRLEGTPVTVCSGCHYDAKTLNLYVAVDSLRVLRITTTGIDYVDNVADGLLFLPSGEPFNVDLEAIRSSQLGMRVEPESLMYEYFNATYASDTIPASHYHQLLCTRILALFFPNFFTARSMLILDAEPGAGKTILAQKAGWLTLGSRFEVSMLSTKREDMETLLTSDVLVVLDNLDEPALIRKHTSLLCQTVTGGKVNRRQLFTDHTKLSYPLVASIICTSIDLGWVRDTIADRSLIIRLAPRIKDEQSNPDVHFKQEALAIRDELMTEVLGRCRNILLALEAQASYQPPHVIRLHDFSGFLMRCAVHEGWADTGLAILRSIAGAQHEEADANNPIHDVIRQFIGSDPKLCGDRISATALGKRFSVAAEDLRLDLKFEWGRYGMRGLLNKQFSSLENKFGLHRQKDPHSNAQQYWFEPTPEVILQCVDFSKQANAYLCHYDQEWMESL